MTTLLLFARGIAFASLLLMSLSSLRYPHSQKTLSFVALTLSLMAYIMIPALSDLPALQDIVISIAILVPLMFWWFCSAIFLDKQLGWRATDKYILLACGIYIAVSYLTFGLNLAGFDQSRAYSFLFYVSYLLRIGFLAASMVAMFSQWNIDLVAKRRSFRLLLLGTGGFYMFMVLVFELALGGEHAPLWLEALNATMLALFFLVLAHWIVTSRPEALFDINKDKVGVSKASTARLTFSEEKWLSSLLRLLDEEAIYRQNGLSIRDLAEQIGVPEHRLRKLINNELGYRNFNDFINHYRLNEVETRLSDPEFEETPVLTLALDSGFSSIAPFNRAFKARYGCTPSTYRKLNSRD